MPTTITGTDGVSQVQAGSIQSDDLAAGAITIGSGDLPAGTVIQVVSNETTTEVLSTSGSYIDTGLSTTITPQFASSKILVLVSQSWLVRNNNGASGQGFARILRSGTVIADEFYNYSFDYGSSGTIQQVPTSLQTLDSPNTTSNIEYKTQGELVNGDEMFFQLSNSRSVITLMEIAG